MRGEWKIILGAALFALIPVGVKLADGAGVYTILTGRLLVASLVIFLVSRNKELLLRITRKEGLLLTGWALLMLCAMLCYFQSIRTCGVAVSSALLGAQPVLLILLSLLVLNEKVSWLSIACAILTVVGIFLVNDPREFFTHDGWGKLLALASAGCLALIFIYQKKFLNKCSSQTLVFYQCGFQLPFLIPLVVIEGSSVNSSVLSSALLLGVVCTAAAYFLIYSGVKTVKTEKIGVLQSIEYVLPVGIGLVFYQEQLRPEIILGSGLILTSCVLVNTKPKQLWLVRKTATHTGE